MRAAAVIPASRLSPGWEAQVHLYAKHLGVVIDSQETYLLVRAVMEAEERLSKAQQGVVRCEAQLAQLRKRLNIS